MRQFTTLMKNETYAQSIFSKFKELESKDDMLYFVTDTITCADMDVSDQRENHLNVNVNATIPVGEMTGMGPGTTLADVEMGGRMERTAKQGGKGTYDGEVIVALGYYAMQLVEPPKRTVFQELRGLFSKPKLSNVCLVALMNPMTGIYFAANPTNGDFATLGDDDGSDSQSEDSTHKDPVPEEGNPDFKFKLYV